MSDSSLSTIRSYDLNKNDAIYIRDIANEHKVSSICHDNSNGNFAVSYSGSKEVESGGAEEEFDGRVALFSQNPSNSVPVIFDRLDFYGDLKNPFDVKIDYIRSKLFIADTGNHNVIKMDMHTKEIESIVSGVYYPHSVCVDINTGNFFVKGYNDLEIMQGKVSGYLSNGTLFSNFVYPYYGEQSSSSSELDSYISESFSSFGESGSSFSGFSSSSSFDIFSVIPSCDSMDIDISRSKLWWAYDNIVYMCDIKKKQLRTFDLQQEGYYDLKSIKIDYSSGNAFLICQKNNEDVVVQIYHDNTLVLGDGYIVFKDMPVTTTTPTTSTSPATATTTTTTGTFISGHCIASTGDEAVDLEGYEGDAEHVNILTSNWELNIPNSWLVGCRAYLLVNLALGFLEVSIYDNSDFSGAAIAYAMSDGTDNPTQTLTFSNGVGTVVFNYENYDFEVYDFFSEFRAQMWLWNM